LKRLKAVLSLMLILALLVPSAIFAVDGVEEGGTLPEERIVENAKLVANKENLLEKEKFEGEPTIEENEDEVVRVVVELKDKPVLMYATDSGNSYAEFNEVEKDEIENKLSAKQEAVKDRISLKVDMEYDKSFTTVFNGFSGKVKFEDIPKIEKVEGVKKVYISNEYEKPEEKPEMVSSNEMIKSQPTWDLGYKGEGTVVAIIDTGVDYTHRDMVITDSERVSLTEEAVDSIIQTGNLGGRYYTEKVPYGYNYYDLNDEILDLGPGASEHGMHVAGTAAANGDLENGGIKGVAPEAQILAMKVFSNDPIYATTFDDIYLGAIEDAIKLGANVLNMSLGSTAGFYEYESPVNSAITNAVNNGVVCSISAGNSGYAQYGWGGNYGYPFKENPDIGLVGTPGLSYDSIQVASVENLSVMTQYLTYEDESDDDEDEVVLPEDTAIVEDNAYSFLRIDEDVNVQKYIVRIMKANKNVYVKTASKIVNLDNEEVADISTIPQQVTFFDSSDKVGKVCFVVKQNEAGQSTGIKIPMSIAGSINPAEVFEGPVPYVDCGTGTLADFEGKDMAGKIALIIRGGNTFVEKITNAQNSGAAGAVIYNHESGGEGLVSMMYPPDGNIPAVFIGNSGGLALKDLENKYVTFHNEVMQAPNPSGGLMSDFSSWGTTPSLELKPEITAPGGQIYSTLQNNNYGIMSGTSMAAPHVTGGSALVMQYLKSDDRYKDLSAGEQARLAKVLLMNTAEVLYDEYDCIYSPRKQGSGLMNLYDAVSTPVRVFNQANGEAKVELKDFDSTTFDMKLKAINDSDEAITYNVDVDVLTDEIHPELDLNLLGTREIDADITGPESITVPANGSIEFTIKVDISEDEEIYRNMFVEGFVRLTEVTDTYPELSVPYVGFYGNWDEPKILDGIRDLDEKSYYEYSGMIDSEFWYMEPGKAAISPGTIFGELNGTDTVTPVLSFMRNAEEVKYNILDKDENLLRKIHTENFVRKTYIDGSSQRPPYSLSFARTWNGEVNNEIVEDGLYYYEIEGKIHYGDRATWQEKRVPVFVDTTPPEISDIEYITNEGNLTWKATDATSGLAYFTIYVDDDKVGDPILAIDGQEEYECQIGDSLKGKVDPEITIVAFDYAYNAGLGVTRLDMRLPYIYLEAPKLLEVYAQNDIEFKGAVLNSESEPTVKINGEVVPVEYDENTIIHDPDDPDAVIAHGPGYKFNTTLTLPDGYHEIKIEASSQGGNDFGIVRRFYVDTTPPELEVSVKEREATSENAQLEITMRDNFPVLLLYVYDSIELNFDGMEEASDVDPIEKTIEVTVPLKIGTNEIPATLYDAAGNETVTTVTVERTEEISEEAAANTEEPETGTEEPTTGTEEPEPEPEVEAETMLEEISALIDTLPEVENITVENYAVVEPILEEIQSKIVEFEGKFGDLDSAKIANFAKYEAICVKVGEVKPEN